VFLGKILNSHLPLFAQEYEWVSVNLSKRPIATSEKIDEIINKEKQ